MDYQLTHTCNHHSTQEIEHYELPISPLTCLFPITIPFLLPKDNYYPDFQHNS